MPVSISPVISKDYLKFETSFGKDQPDYIPLPAIYVDGVVISRWKFSFIERLKILFKGTLFLSVWTFGNSLQPVKLHTELILNVNAE